MSAPTVLHCRHSDGQPRMTNPQAVAAAKRLNAEHRNQRRQIVPVWCDGCGSWAVAPQSRAVRAARRRRRHRAR